MHKKLILLVVLSITFIQLIAQPAGYVPGTQVCWPINGRPCGYFKAAGNGERHILISFTGNGETTCSGPQSLENQAPQKWLKDNGYNWDGRTVRAPGDTIVWEVFTIPQHNDNWLEPYARDIDSFFAKIAYIDLNDRSKFHIEGLSGGVGRMWGYMTNQQGHNSPYRHLFSTTISMSGSSTSNFSSAVHDYSADRRHWVWHGTYDTTTTPVSFSQALYNSLQGSKRLTLQTGGHHGPDTWDSCMSLHGADTNTNRWLWMVRKPIVTIPEDTCTQGPPNYVRGTQVCWTFNNRKHGYFRAAGKGERHILVSFTGDNIDSCNDFEVNSPQKWLQDAGFNWDGRTVRAPGDTIVWEVLTIEHTSSNWLPDYASDINYFFTNICSIDSLDSSRFHIMGLGGGVGRMWGYLTNSQNHNSPYRNLFSTTISMSTTWQSTFGTKRDYSIGRRHWIWHGSLDGGVTPPAASQQLYDSIAGTKHLTLLSGGGHNAYTWDSCLNLNGGVDTTTNRWLWMVSHSGSGARRAVTISIPPPQTKALLYPNPGRNNVLINASNLLADAYTIRVIDIMGRTHKVVSNIRDRYYQLDISALRNGIYVIQVQAGNYKVQQKLVKE